MKATPMPALTIERSVFEQYNARLVEKHLGKFVLIKGDKIYGIYDTREEGESAGDKKFGPGASFLVRRILASAETADSFQLLNLDAYISNS